MQNEQLDRGLWMILGSWPALSLTVENSDEQLAEYASIGPLERMRSSARVSNLQAELRLYLIECMLL